VELIINCMNCVVIVASSLGQHAFSRAYINLLNRQDVAVFIEKFDGYVFVDSRGKQHNVLSRAVLNRGS